MPLHLNTRMADQFIIDETYRTWEPTERYIRWLTLGVIKGERPSTFAELNKWLAQNQNQAMKCKKFTDDKACMFLATELAVATCLFIHGCRPDKGGKMAIIYLEKDAQHPSELFTHCLSLHVKHNPPVPKLADAFFTTFSETAQIGGISNYMAGAKIMMTNVLAVAVLNLALVEQQKWN